MEKTEQRHPSEEAAAQTRLVERLTEKLHQMTVLSQVLSAELYALCDSYEAGDQVAILRKLKQISERRVAAQGCSGRRH